MKKQPNKMAWTHVPPFIPFRCLSLVAVAVAVGKLQLQCIAAALLSVAVPMPLSPLFFSWDDSSPA